MFRSIETGVADRLPIHLGFGGRGGDSSSNEGVEMEVVALRGGNSGGEGGNGTRMLTVGERGDGVLKGTVAICSIYQIPWFFFVFDDPTAT